VDSWLGDVWSEGLATWRPALILVAVALAASGLVRIALRVVASLGRRARVAPVAWTIDSIGRATTLLAPVVAVRFALPLVSLPEAIAGVIDHATQVLAIAGAGWLLASFTHVLDYYLAARFDLDASDNLTARRVHTRFRLLRRVLVSVIALVTFAGVLITFPAARSLGAGILASAGIAGIALGIAARPTLEAWIAGVQVAITEPIRIDDVVIVEGEWGRIEQITATYVVVQIWDLRRLIVPVRYFLDQPFQNWTRVSADLTGVVTVEVDYTTPVEEARAAAEEIVRGSDLWDGKFWNLQVVEAGERTMRLRVLASARDASVAWDLRCEIREKLIAWLQQNHPECLPRLRASLETDGPIDQPTGA